MRAIIFDLDGVIVSTDEQHYLAWKALSNKLGISFDRTVNNRFRGVSRMDCMNILAEIGKKNFTDAEKLEYATWKNELYREYLAEMSEKDLDTAVKETLDALRKKGILLAIGSSSKNAKFILDRLGLGDYFDAVSDGTNITRSKPDPEVFLKAAEMLSVAPEDCLVVEDALSGVEAARRAKMKVATVGDAAEKHCGNYILNTFSDLLNI